MLQNARGWYDKGIFGNDYLPGNTNQWLKAIQARNQRKSKERKSREIKGVGEKSKESGVLDKDSRLL